MTKAISPIKSYPHIYLRLKLFGFSPAKAAEILLDARRKNWLAQRMVLLALGRSDGWSRPTSPDHFHDQRVQKIAEQKDIEQQTSNQSVSSP